MPSPKPRIAITSGDPAGVGPELSLRAAADAALCGICTPILFADEQVLARVADACGFDAPPASCCGQQRPPKCRDLKEPTIVDLQAIDADDVTPGEVSAATGRAAYRYVEAAIAAATAGEVDAVVTGPIHKEALSAAGVLHPGHTEIFAELTGAARHCMMLTSEEITCSFVTGHIGLKDVPGAITSERIVEVIELSDAAMRKIRGRQPRLIVCGLNPHAGEHGLFGDREEERLIAPAVAAAQRRGYDVAGPLPPDTAFVPKLRGQTDCYVCMYHDQGLIPLKALAFDTAVNITLGLPIIRTSVDHGTALDIAWRGIADATSLFSAVRLAAQLAEVDDSQGAAEQPLTQTFETQ